MLWYAMLFDVPLCYDIYWSVMSGCVMLLYDMICYAMICYVVL